MPDEIRFAYHARTGPGLLWVPAAMSQGKTELKLLRSLERQLICREAFPGELKIVEELGGETCEPHRGIAIRPAATVCRTLDNSTRSDDATPHWL